MKKILFTLLCCAVSMMHATDNTQSLQEKTGTKKYCVTTLRSKRIVTTGAGLIKNESITNCIKTFVEYGGTRIYYSETQLDLMTMLRDTHATNLDTSDSTQAAWLDILKKHHLAKREEVLRKPLSNLCVTEAQQAAAWTAARGGYPYSESTHIDTPDVELPLLVGTISSKEFVLNENEFLLNKKTNQWEYKEPARKEESKA